MDDPSRHYLSGEEIQPGDRITLAGAPGLVVFVLGREDVPADWVYLESEQGRGFMLDVEGMGYVFYPESDEDLEFIARASTPPT